MDDTSTQAARERAISSLCQRYGISREQADEALTRLLRATDDALIHGASPAAQFEQKIQRWNRLFLHPAARVFILPDRLAEFLPRS